MRGLRCFLLLAMTVGASDALAQSRTPWQMHDGLEVSAQNPLGLIPFDCRPSRHGDICLYNVATIPDAADASWFGCNASNPSGANGACTDPDIINLVRVPSYVCQAPVTCFGYGDFSYFQTFVDIPGNVAVTQFTIAFQGMDDGSRVTIFNSAYPTGLVIPGSYVYLGGAGTTNLAPYVIAGETNRVVITQVDDCCSHNYLREARVVLNGQVVETDDDADDDGVPQSSDCDDADPTIGALLYQNGFDADTGYFQSPPQLSRDPWVHDSSAIHTTDGGQQATLGQPQDWSDIVVYATVAATGTWGGCSTCSQGPTNRWRAGVLLRGERNDVVDEGFHGYRCALASNATGEGGAPYAGPSTGQFLQLAEFMNAEEDDWQFECNGGPNPTFDELDRERYDFVDIAAGEVAQLEFRAVGNTLSCEMSAGGQTVAVSSPAESFLSGRVGLSTLNMFGHFQDIRVCEVLSPQTVAAAEPAPSSASASAGGVLAAEEPSEATGHEPRAALAATDAGGHGCGVAGNSAPTWFALLLAATAFAGRRRRSVRQR